MNIFYISLATIVGALLPLQALINSKLGSQIGGSLWAATISFVVGTIGLICLLVFSRQPFPAFMTASQNLPFWTWFGGLLGALYVATTIFAVKPLGTSTMILLLVAGQMVGALLLEHFGVLQNPNPVTPIKVFGIIFVFVGVLMVMKK